MFSLGLGLVLVLFLRLTPLPPAPYSYSIAVYFLGADRVSPVARNTLLSCYSGTSWNPAGVVLHVIQGFVSFVLRL